MDFIQYVSGNQLDLRKNPNFIIADLVKFLGNKPDILEVLLPDKNTSRYNFLLKKDEDLFSSSPNQQLTDSGSSSGITLCNTKVALLVAQIRQRNALTLETLFLQNNNISYPVMRKLMRAIKSDKLPVLKTLDLSGNKINISSMMELTEALFHLPSLTSLSLSRSQIHDTEFEILINNLPYLAKLHNINLTLNLITSKGASHFLSVITYNNLLSKIQIDLSKNPIANFSGDWPNNITFIPPTEEETNYANIAINNYISCNNSNEDFSSSPGLREGLLISPIISVAGSIRNSPTSVLEDIDLLAPFEVPRKNSDILSIATHLQTNNILNIQLFDITISNLHQIIFRLFKQLKFDKIINNNYHIVDNLIKQNDDIFEELKNISNNLSTYQVESFNVIISKQYTILSLILENQHNMLPSLLNDIKDLQSQSIILTRQLDNTNIFCSIKESEPPTINSEKINLLDLSFSDIDNDFQENIQNSTNTLPMTCAAVTIPLEEMNISSAKQSFSSISDSLVSTSCDYKDVRFLMNILKDQYNFISVILDKTITSQVAITLELISTIKSQHSKIIDQLNQVIENNDQHITNILCNILKMQHSGADQCTKYPYNHINCLKNLVTIGEDSISMLNNILAAYNAPPSNNIIPIEKLIELQIAEAMQEVIPNIKRSLPIAIGNHNLPTQTPLFNISEIRDEELPPILIGEDLDF